MVVRTLVRVAIGAILTLVILVALLAALG